ncbi:hypothetical protein BX616_001105 [Lobosporangium transversale]|uniref:SET domain-containing protein n=1 Tax=Lobosporangium transversale TaxID=64571 RepID=A0A1Y2GHR5_9FUNG|nr:hypothetical protein BCR41DRAFT_357025 [Lobosporangium transversale]KAF9905062.1 hypothetical protein BX616_001105 [Lobosporangium transversale]ORZ11320.1 hypothetical protein BCR41DRAFT_357025 [Lobosporangium transversale]|eukprot:XP_021879635.1 hypothetical protein BCR41DRAFT_357025 [Lobosporangium transversale]
MNSTGKERPLGGNKKYNQDIAPMDPLDAEKIESIVNAKLNKDLEQLLMPKTISSIVQQPLQQQETQEHVSTIDPDLLPVNWPKHVKYLLDYEYHLSIPVSLLDIVQGRRRQQKELQQIEALGKDRKERYEEDKNKENESDDSNKNKEEKEGDDGPRSELESDYDDIPIGHAIPGSLRTLSSDPPPYEIRFIDSPPDHPVLGSYGLFATKLLRPGLHLLDYISLVVPDGYADPNSDHTLYLCNDLNLDASVHGNHGRFVNDFRGIRTQEQGPNVCWDLHRDVITGQVRMGCKVLKRIQPGEEILCTYGKAYWKSRGILVTGNEWEDEWDTDLDDQSDDDDDAK